MMKDAFLQSLRLWRAFAFVALAATPLLFVGCNAGTAGLVIYFLLDDDDDSGSKTGPAKGVLVSFLGVQNNRTNPAGTRIGFRLVSENRGVAELRIEFRVDDGEFQVLEPTEIDSGRVDTDERGPHLSNLLSTPDGVAHEFVWDALAQLGTDDLSRVELRFIATNQVDVPVFFGNDAPTIDVLEVIDLGDGALSLEIALSDETFDLADVTAQVTPVIKNPSEESFSAILTDSPLTRLPTTPNGAGSAFHWRGREQLGSLDRVVLVRVIARDLVGETTERVSEPRVATFLLDLNSDPVARDVTIARNNDLRDNDEGSGDRRRGLSIGFVLEDREGDDVDVIVQWASGDEDFPDLPMTLDIDPLSREHLLRDPESAETRWNLQIASLRPEPLSGAVEQPGGEGDLEDREILATWLLNEETRRGAFAALKGRTVRLLRAEPVDDASDERVVCGFDPVRGVLTLNEAFEPLEAPGDRIEIDTAGALRLATTEFGDEDAQSVHHHVIWGSDLDIPGGGPIRVRVTPFDRAFVAPEDPLAACEPAPPYDLEGAMPGDRGEAAESDSGVDLRGPFGERGAWATPLAPVDDPSALAVADIDEDGRLDIVAVSSGARSLVLKLQTADASFDELRLLDERIGDPTDVVVADLDGDDDLDIAVTTRAFSTAAVPEEGVPAFDHPGSVMLYFQDENFDFIPNRVPLRAGGVLVAPSSIAAADFDGDGDLDLAVGDAEPDGTPLTIFFRGDREGGLAGCDDSDAAAGYSACREQVFVALPRIHDMVATDYDGDGDNDLIFATGDGLAVWINVGNGGFEAVARVAQIEPTGEFRSVAYGDINADGRPDWIGGDPIAGEVVAALGSDGEQFELMTLRTENMTSPRSLLISDVDANGADDLLIADAGGGDQAGHVTICLADTSGGLTCDSISRAGDVSPQDLAVGDFDLDGLLDIATVEGGVSEVAVYLQEAPGTFQSLGRSFDVLEEGFAPTALASGDLDSNGYLDLAVASATSSTITLLRQQESGDLDAEAVTSDDASGFSDVELSDINGDGRVDLIAASLVADLIEIRHQDADGSFDDVATTLRSDALRGLQSFATGDLDGDGRLDIVAVGRFSETVVSFQQGPDGSFAENIVLGSDVVSSPIDVVLEDLSGDGLIDGVIASHTSGEIVIVDSLAESEPGVVALPEGTRPLALRTADVDGDGVQDILVASEAGSSAVVRSDGEGGFSVLDLSPIVESTSAVGLSAIDADLDGQPELVLTSASGGRLEVLRANPKGVAVARTLEASDIANSAPHFVPSATLAVDFDGDGEGDLVTVNRASDSVVVFWGDR